jgi:hypothetical protein
VYRWHRERPGRRLVLGDHGVGWVVAPDQSMALFAGGGDGNDGRLLVVDPRRLRRLGTIRLRSPWWEWPYASSWLGPSRVLLAGSGNFQEPDGAANATAVTVVDPAARRVVAQRTLPGELLASGRLPDGLVLLAGPPEGIGPARVAVVDAGGRARTVSLPGIAAGFQEPADWSQAGASSRRAQPSLAVDPDGRRAFVVGAGTPVAVVEQWQWLRPSGLQLVDTRTWQAATIQPDASGAVWAGGRLLAYGRLLGPPADPDGDEPTQQTYGLTCSGRATAGRSICSAPARSTGWRPTATAPTST